MNNSIKLIISDFHLAAGKWLKDGRRNPLEDFLQDDRFADFLEHYSTDKHEKADVELIINGDFFDPLAVLPIPNGHEKLKAEHPLDVEEAPAVEKFRSIVEGHPVAIESLRTFLKRGKRVVFRWGNHDASMLWPKVQTYLREVFAPPDPKQLTFQVEPYIFDRICIDHGHQFEVLNQFDENNVFIQRKSKSGFRTILNFPFGSFFVVGFLNRLKLQRSYITQVQPFRAFLKLSFFGDPVFFFLNGFRVMWFFVKMRFVTHPMRFSRIKKTLLLILEAFHRPSLEEVAEKVFKSDPQLPYDTLIMGHNHQAKLRIFPNGRQYINTGTWTPITSLDFGNLGHRTLRTYAFIEYKNGQARASLKIWHGTQRVSEDYS